MGNQVNTQEVTPLLPERAGNHSIVCIQTSAVYENVFFIFGVVLWAYCFCRSLQQGIEHSCCAKALELTKSGYCFSQNPA